MGRRPAMLLLVLALGLLAMACTTTGNPGAVGGVDPVTASLIAGRGYQPSGPTDARAMQVGDPAELPWDLYLKASRLIGLDFTAATGQPAELRTTPIAGSNLADRVHVLVVDDRPIGAWLSSESAAPGIYSLTGTP